MLQGSSHRFPVPDLEMVLGGSRAFVSEDPFMFIRPLVKSVEEEKGEEKNARKSF